MKTSSKIGGVVAALMLAVSGATFAAQPDPYVHDVSGDVVHNVTGLCWRTGFWTPALAEALGVDGCGCKCDADILDAAACKAVEEPAAPQAAEKVTFSADMLFDFGSANLKPEGQAVLDDLVSRIAGVDLEVIMTTGYTDRIGSDAYNLKLSQARADSVKDYLAAKGVDASLVKAEGMGKADPVVECANTNRRDLVNCLAPNRRATVEVVGARPAK